MDRRTWLGGVLCLLSAPVAADAQPTGRLYRIGLLAAGASPWIIDPFVASMRELGWREARDFLLEPRYTGAGQDQAALLASELVHLNVDLILVLNTANAQAARRASQTIPVVMLLSGYPVEAGLAKSLGRPGGNVTGLSIYAGGDLWGKYVQLLKELRPDLRSFAVLWDYAPPGFVQEENDVAIGEMKRAASAVGVAVRVLLVRTRGDLEGAIRMLEHERIDALFVTNGPVQRQPDTASMIMEFARKHRLPTMTDLAGNVFAAGCLMTYSANPGELGRSAARFVDRIFRGAKPADLPIEQPTKFELRINLKTARALGLTIPPALLARADEIIQ